MENENDCDEYGQVVSVCGNYPTPSSSSGGNWSPMYCDYGPILQIGGYCFEMEDENDCDEYGQVVSVCGNYPTPSSSSNQPPSSSSSAAQMVYCKLVDGRCFQESYSVCMLIVNQGAAEIVSSCNSSGTWYCDYGPRHTCFESGCENFIGGGCFEISGSNPSAAECDREWATITQSCKTSGDFCDYGPLTVDSDGDCGGTGYCGGCYKYASNCVSDGGSRVTTCPASSLTVSGGGTQTSFTDTRDSKVYKTVVIGTQTWMAENLNYNASGSKCYDNLSSYCNIYGRLYDWSTAMNLPSSCNSNSCSSQIQTKHKGVCPSGWHIPSSEDWGRLSRYADGTSGTFAGYDSETAGRYLKATSGWNNNGNGTNNYGFSALPGGGSTSNGDFVEVGRYGYCGGVLASTLAVMPMSGLCPTATMTQAGAIVISLTCCQFVA